MAITRAQQFRQMLEDGGMLVQPGFGGTRQGYKKSFESQNRDKQKTSYSSPQVGSFGSGLAKALADQKERAKPPGDDDQDADAIAMAQAMENQKFKGRRVVKDPVTGQIKTDLRTRPDKLADLKEKLRKFKANRRKVTIPGIGFGKGLEGIAQALSDFGAKFNRPYFERVIAAERIPGLDLSTIINMTEEEIEDAYDSYMADRLAGKTDAMGNLKAGFMRDATGKIISTGNDGREDPIIPVMAKAMEDDTEEEYVNPLSLLTPRIAGSRYLGSEFAADGGRIGYDDGGMLVSPSKDGKRPGYRRSKYDSTGGGLASSSKASDISPGPGDDDSPQQTTTTTKKTTKPFGDDSAALKFTPRQLASFGIFGDPKKRQQLAKVYGTKDIEKLLGIIDEESAEKFVKDPIFGGAEFIDEKGQANIMEKFRENLLEQETKFPAKGFDAQRSAAQTLGISPTNRSLIPSDFLTKPGEAATQKPFEDIAADIAEQYGLAEGGTVNQNLPILAAEGGIMDLGRQELFLGGIVKGLKKAAKGVSRTLKKVAKSPIGKAALFAGLAGIPFGAGSAGTGFFGPKSLFGRGMGFLSTMKANKALQAAGSSDYFGGATGILDFFRKNPLLAIGGVSALSGLLTKKGDDDDEDEFLRQYYNMRLDPSLSVRGTGSEFDFYKPQFVADGGRIGYQEGSKEPVAKKTMPLLDMDGQEMDLRDNGGFVPIGRMEKADDVPARLSKNEFVFTADAVRNAGDGDVDKGAEVMYNMMKNLERGGNVSDESQGLEGAREMFQTSKRLEEVL